MFKLLKHASIGFLMGIADLIPGISGGTVAYLTGIYPQLLLALRDFNRKRVLFLCVLVSGMVSAIFSFSHVIKFVFSDPRVQTAFFSYCVGLILASIHSFWPKGKVKILEIILMSLGIITGYLLTFLTISTYVGLNGISIIFIGIFTICATLLPGISGSYILMLFDLYHPVIQAITHPFQSHHFFLLFKLAIGILIGAIVFSRVILYLMNHFFRYMNFFFLSFVIGTLPKLISFISLQSFYFIFLFLGFFTYVLLKKIYRIVTPLIQSIA